MTRGRTPDTGLLGRLERLAAGQYGDGPPGLPKPGSQVPPPLHARGFAEAWSLEFPASPAAALHKSRATPEPAPPEAADARVAPVSREGRAPASPPPEPDLPTAELHRAQEIPLDATLDAPPPSWRLSVPPAPGQPPVMGPLAPTAMAAQRRVPPSPAATATPKRKAIEPPPLAVQSDPAVAEIASPRNLPGLPPQPQPRSQPPDRRNAPGGGAQLSIGRLDIRITPPPEPDPGLAEKPAPKPRRDRHGTGLSASSLMRRAGVRRF